MNVALLNCRITIQENAVIIDSIGNHKNGWKDYYSCYATINSESGTEVNTAGETLESNRLAMTIRYSSETAAIEPTKHRILFDGDIYNITAVDNMNYNKRSLKIWCQKVRR